MNNPYQDSLAGLEIADPVRAFFDWCIEREAIRVRREAGQPPPGSLPEPLTNPLFSIRQGWIIGIALWAVAVECLLVRRVQRRVVGESFWEIGIGDEEFSEGDGIRITGL